MKSSAKPNFLEKDSMVLIGISLAVAFWAIESFMHIFRVPGFTLSESLFNANLYDIYTRVVVLCLFLIFGSHVQFTINNRKKAEDALRESEEKYRSILESIEEGYYEIDLNGEIIFFNDSFARILGYSAKDILGRNQKDFLDTETAELLSQENQKVLQTGKPNTLIEIEYVNREGTRRIIEASIALFRDSRNEPAGLRGIARDVTEKRFMERKLIEADKKLQAARGCDYPGACKTGGIPGYGYRACIWKECSEYSKILAQALSDFPAYTKVISPKKYIDDVFQLFHFA